MKEQLINLAKKYQCNFIFTKNETHEKIIIEGTTQPSSEKLSIFIYEEKWDDYGWDCSEYMTVMTADPHIKIAKYEDGTYKFYSHQEDKDDAISLRYKELSVIHSIIQHDKIYNKTFKIEITKFRYNNVFYDVVETYDPTPNSTIEEVHKLLDERYTKKLEKNKYIF